MKKLIWPVFVELVLQMLVGNIDQIMLSGYNDTAVAAVGNANTIMNVVILVFSVLSTAASILISQSIGARNEGRLGSLYTLALFLNGVLGVVFWLLLWAVIGPLYTVMQVPQELLADAMIYIRIVALSVPFQAVLATLGAIFRSNARMKTTMQVSILYNLVNVVGNQLLINGLGPIPGLGTAGVAISTLVSRGIGVVIMWVIFRRSITNATFDLRRLRPFPRDIMRQMLHIGLPSGGENLSWDLSQLVCLGIINTFGTAAITARTYVYMMANLCYLYSSACGQALQVAVGYHVGAGNFEEADRLTRRTLRTSSIIAVAVAGVICLFAKPLYGLLSQDPNVLEIVVIISFIEVFLEFGRVFNIVYVRAMQAAGDVIFPVVLGIAAEWMITVGAGYLFGVVLDMGLPGVWLSFCIDECLRAVICHIRWRRGIWRNYAAAMSAKEGS